MKITPVMTGGMPGQNLGAVSTERTSPDRIAAAKAIAIGEMPVTMTESDTPTDPQLRRMQETRRKIKMRTQQTTGYIPEEDMQAPQELQSTPESVISKPIEGNEEVVEATKPLAPQAAALARERRALQRERQLFEQEKARQGQSTTDGDQGLTARLKSQPLSVLQELGALTPEFYQAMTEYLTTGQSGINPEIQALKDEIKSLKEGVDKRFVDTETQAEESALTEMLFEAEALAKDGEAYDLIRRKDAFYRVLRHVYSTYKKTGRVVDVRDAMNHIESQLEKEAEFYFEVPKLKTKFQPQQLPPVQQQQPRQMRTLTNRDTAVPPMDRRTRALLAATGQLKRG